MTLSPIKKRYMDRMKFYSNDEKDSAHLAALRYVNGGDVVLSAGCGSGREVKVLKEKHCKITAIDYDEEMIESSKKIASAEYILGNFSTFRRENTYDKIICLFNTIPWLNEYQLREFINNSFFNLKEGGSLIITFMDRYGSMNSIANYLLGRNNNYTLGFVKSLLGRFKIKTERIYRYSLIIATK